MELSDSAAHRHDWSSLLPVYLIHWRQPDWCIDAATSILASDTPVKLTIINNSPEDNAELVRRLPPRVDVIETNANIGYAGGGNVALRSWLEETEASFVVIGSHDLLVTPDALGILLDAARSNPDFGLIGPNIKGRETDFVAGLADVSWLSGTCLLLRRQCVKEVGGFDEALGSYCEDVDICWRAAKQNWRVGHCAAAPVSGRGSGSPEARDAAWINGVRVKRLHKGNLAAARELGRILVAWWRCLLGSILPFRPTMSRRASRTRLRSLSRSLRNISMVYAEVETSVAPHAAEL